MLSALLAHVRQNVVGYVALFVALGGVTYAAIPDGGGVIHGCYDTSNPQEKAYPLYVIDSATTATCPKGTEGGQMTPLTWNQQGSPGSAGSPGAPGSPAAPAAPAPPAPGANALSDSPQLLLHGMPPNGKETGVWGQSSISFSADGVSQTKSVTLYCPKNYPVPVYPSINTWFWKPSGIPQENTAFAIAELFEYTTFPAYTHNIHSARVQSGRGRGARQGWTTEWQHDPPIGAYDAGHSWGVELEVNCLTVAASKQYVVNLNIAK